MLDRKTLQAIESIIGEAINHSSTVSGGDINDAFCIQTNRKSFFVKSNDAPFANDMFEKEADGLRLIEQTNTIAVPKIIGHHTTDHVAFLILEWIESASPNLQFWKNFGTQLALLHQQSVPTFGLNYPNYIGSLVQKNELESDAISFLINQRLMPQIELANSHNKIDSNTMDTFQKLFKKLPELIPNEKPSLIHGDLWNGNFMADKNGKVVLVDPSATYGLREFDLAMSKLFGGFDSRFYNSYENTFPTEKGLEDRIPIYQLYYLMVHVNLFGGGYLNSVKNILSKF